MELINYKFSVEYEKLENLELLARPRFSSTGFYGKLIKDKNKIYFKSSNILSILYLNIEI